MFFNSKINNGLHYYMEYYAAMKMRLTTDMHNNMDISQTISERSQTQNSVYTV